MTKWAVSILGLAALKIAFGVAGYFQAVANPAEVPPDFGALHMLVYGAVAALLIYNRDRDPRTIWLGAAFALVAVVPADGRGGRSPSEPRSSSVAAQEEDVIVPPRRGPWCGATASTTF